MANRRRRRRFSEHLNREVSSTHIYRLNTTRRLVLDSFAVTLTLSDCMNGSSWFMARLGDHCHRTFSVAEVVTGKIRGGVTELTTWQGGGGFRYYTCPSLIQEGEFGQLGHNKVLQPRNMARRAWQARMASLCTIAVHTRTGHAENDFIYVHHARDAGQFWSSWSDEVRSQRIIVILLRYAFEFANRVISPNLLLKKYAWPLCQVRIWGKGRLQLEIQASARTADQSERSNLRPGLPPEPAKKQTHKPASSATCRYFGFGGRSMSRCSFSEARPDDEPEPRASSFSTSTEDGRRDVSQFASAEGTVWLTERC